MKSNQIIGFNGNNVRVVYRNGEPWWALTDVCKVLGIQNPAQAAQRLDDDEKGIYQTYTPGGNQNILITNESGLYSVILRSDKPEARMFKRWITHEVLPMIRTFGYYIPSHNRMELGTAIHEVIESEIVNLFSLSRWPMQKEVTTRSPYDDFVRFDLVRQNTKFFMAVDIKSGLFNEKTMTGTLVKGYQESVYRKAGKRKAFLIFVGPGLTRGGENCLEAADDAKGVEYRYWTYKDLYTYGCNKIQQEYNTPSIGFVPKVIEDMLAPSHFPYLSGQKSFKRFLTAAQ